jgi:regulator of chromosome condensation
MPSLLLYYTNKNQGNNGAIGFSQTSQQELRPVLINNLTDVAKLVAGAQHMLALTSEGKVFSWGCNEQYQLGRQRSHYIITIHLQFTKVATYMLGV